MRMSNNNNRRQKKTTVVVSAELSPHFRCNQEYAQFLFFQDRPWITEAPKIKASFLFPQNYLWISDVIKTADNFCVFQDCSRISDIKKKKGKKEKKKERGQQIFPVLAGFSVDFRYDQARELPNHFSLF